MVALFALAFSCLATGSPATDCLAVAWTESGCGVLLDHGPATVHGLCGVDERWSPLPAWALRTTIGGAVGCGLAIRMVRERYGSQWPAYFVCSRKGVKRGLPSCVRAAEKLRRALMRLRPHGEV